MTKITSHMSFLDYIKEHTVYKHTILYCTLDYIQESTLYYKHIYTLHLHALLLSLFLSVRSLSSGNNTILGQPSTILTLPLSLPSRVVWGEEVVLRLCMR